MTKCASSTTTAWLRRWDSVVLKILSSRLFLTKASRWQNIKWKSFRLSNGSAVLKDTWTTSSSASSTSKATRNLVPRVFHLPTPKGAREERPWLRLITCLGNKFIFKGGVLNYQSIVTAAVCHLLNRLSGQPWKALFRFRSEDLSYQVHCFQHLKLNWVWKLRKHKNVKL